MENTQRPETPLERFKRRTRNYTELRYVTKMAGLEFYSEPLARDTMLNRMDLYGMHPAGRITGLHRIEGRAAEGSWETV